MSLIVEAIYSFSLMKQSTDELAWFNPVFLPVNNGESEQATHLRVQNVRSRVFSDGIDGMDSR